MSRKRLEYDDRDDQQPNRLPTVSNFIRMRELSFHDHEIASVMEPSLRNWVKEEVEQALERVWPSSQRPPFFQTESCGPKNWLLQFNCKLRPTLFTGNRIEAEDGTPVQVVILDAISGRRIISDSLSSVKVEILVLKGDFSAEEWTEQEFNASILRERDGRRPLLIGNQSITLRNGLGYFSDISFTDNSKWTRSGKFRLGAKIVKSNLRVREAKSEAFAVKDRRGVANEKHHPPSLDDDIWRLKKISKNGVIHNRLASIQIKTVKDFLQAYNANFPSLFSLFQKMNSIKTWNAIIQHATTCVVNDQKFYKYTINGHRVGLLFDSVYKAIGAEFDGAYLSLENLDSSQKFLVEELKQRAYKNLEDLVSVDDNSLFGPSRPLSCLHAEPFRGPNLDSQHRDVSDANLDQQVALPGCSYSVSSSLEVEDDSLLEVSMFPNFLMAHVSPLPQPNTITEDCHPGAGWESIEFPAESEPVNHFCIHGISQQSQTSTWFNPNPST